MRLTAGLIDLSDSYINAIGDRELDLRAQGIPAIENLGASKDQNDCIDLSDNNIRKIENLPLLRRLKTLMLSNNRISRADAGLSAFIPNLENLILNNNQFHEVTDLGPLLELKNLKVLSLLDNPVTKKPHYRSLLIHKLPLLRILDFRKIKDKERQAAAKSFSGEKGLQLEASLVSKNAGSDQATTENKAGLTVQEVTSIKKAIQNATSMEEIQRLERQLQTGDLPK